MLYARKVKQDHTKSLVYELETARGDNERRYSIPAFYAETSDKFGTYAWSNYFECCRNFKFEWTFGEMSANFYSQVY